LEKIKISNNVQTAQNLGWATGCLHPVPATTPLQIVMPWTAMSEILWLVETRNLS